ncbi:hypothetical protein [Rhizomicrobium electricum]|uniref:Uncharacterized protein n=1 Tax=Rhizomicrobium electricum TaxID=480070 RepID=A0ABN1EMU5_9PROT|nr:hypothetical protein [Rhizomicrobium electricum]NIJ46927.1 hypothetical protein [Rhizomicrobium electricum]
MLVAALILLLLVPMQVAVIYIIGRFFLKQATGPLSRLREPEIRRDFFWLMLTSGLYTGVVVFLLDTYLPGA